jgi:hypothetical protein
MGEIAMKFMTTWKVRPDAVKEAVSMFFKGMAEPREGVKYLGRWHAADMTGGFTLSETENAALIYEQAGIWIGVMDMHTVPVIEDADAGAVLAKVFGK